MKITISTLIFLLSTVSYAEAETIFDYGVATKGPLTLAGSIMHENRISVESDVYVESYDSNEALSMIGNAHIVGEVKIANADATVALHGPACIGGDTGEAALNHVTFGAAPLEFPIPVPAYFEHYAANIIDSSTDTSEDASFDNVRIAAGTNPIFTSSVIFRGVVFIETPNVVIFAGSTTITGIIIGGGDVNDNSATNQIYLLGSVESYPVSELPDEPQFAGLHEETGTFILAPGFHVFLSANFGTLSGAIAGNGITFLGDAGGTVNGTLVNYSDEPTELSGNNDLCFHRSGSGVCPWPSLLVPNGGETLVSGSSYVIRWLTVPKYGWPAGFIPASGSVFIPEVLIEYSCDNGQSWHSIDTVSNRGSYEWLVPEVDSNQCLVRVSDANHPGVIADTSDDVFTIFQCRQAIRGDLDGDCYVNLRDLALLAAMWTKCGNPFDPACGME